MGVNVVGHESAGRICCGGGWGFVRIVGLWGHWLVLIRIALVAFVIFVQVDVEGAGDVGTCCIGGEEWGKVGDKGHCRFLASDGGPYNCRGVFFKVRD
jgi:hypothetical protein